MSELRYHPTYSEDKRDLLVPVSCPVCRKCWAHVGGARHGKCVFGGPYRGYSDELCQISRGATVSTPK